ncbi:ubiquinol-cytochrome c reductase cytochrome b subunit [Blastococcus sp. BMG 814]|uniref:Cytochrome bc1 complex cytochrome b subunit n=1 Tax=Blastococcus carthaginiensis TaxID=3050034 RepID=A0ABT9I8C3_9ACTN|nr:ubiquinol-cytochrome c reductase cytochrome b subunit [Blastococcus carthaginiensis]MDP5181817.1 ubiquinol-cytochrome c reductase cytochrome b subunit [Blastococcus carthaginiensis]
MIIRRAVQRTDERLGFSSTAKSGLNKVFPDHWSFMIGEIALYSFVYLVLSGVFLTLFFDASTARTVYEGSYDAMHGSETSAAYASALQLSHDVRMGLVIRQSHHWAALLFTGAIVVHLCRIFFTGAFRRPRGINWAVGVTLLLLAIVNGFAGYSLPDDLLSGTGLRVANAVLLSIPVVGGWLAFLVWGGEFPAEAMIERLYVVHILVVPALITALITAHMVILVRQKHTHFPGPGRTDTNVVGSRLWPAYAVRSVGLLFFVVALALALGGLVQINPIWYWGPFEPGSATAPAQPDWYVGWVDGALRLMPPWEPVVFGYRLSSVFLPAVVLPGLTFLVLYLWPWLERLVTGDRREHQVLQRPRDCPGRVAAGVAALTFYGVLLIAFSLDIVSQYTGIAVFALVHSFRVAVLVLPLLTGAVAFVLARALRDSDAEGLLALTGSDLRRSLRRHREVPAELSGADDAEQRPATEPEHTPTGPVGRDEEESEPVRVEAGPVP